MTEIAFSEVLTFPPRQRGVLLTSRISRRDLPFLMDGLVDALPITPRTHTTRSNSGTVLNYRVDPVKLKFLSRHGDQAVYMAQAVGRHATRVLAGETGSESRAITYTVESPVHKAASDMVLSRLFQINTLHANSGLEDTPGNLAITAELLAYTSPTSNQLLPDEERVPVYTQNFATIAEHKGLESYTPEKFEGRVIPGEFAGQPFQTVFSFTRNA